MQSGMNRYGLISGALLALATIVSAAGGGVGDFEQERCDVRLRNVQARAGGGAGGGVR